MNLAYNRISVDEKSRDLAQFVNEIQKNELTRLLF